MHLVDMIRNAFNSIAIYLGYNSVIETSFTDGPGSNLVLVDVPDSG